VTHARAALAAALALLACGTATRGPCEPEPGPGQLGSVCGFQSPEDVEFVAGAGLLLVSEMRRGPSGGAIAGLPLDEAGRPTAAPRRLWPGPEAAVPDGRGDPECSAPPPAAAFAPHGLRSGASGDDGSVPVAVVHHGARESLELFDLVGTGAAARLLWRGCVPLPEGTAGNDVDIAPGGALLVSNYQPTLEGWRGLWHTLRGGAGLSTGDVRVWSPSGGWRTLPGTRSANPNGVLWSADARAALFAVTHAGSVRRVAVSDPGPPEAAIEVEGRPDNLSRSADGGVFVVTHLSGPAVLLCRFRGGPCRSGWALLQLAPELTRARTLLRHDGEVVGAAASASQAGERIYIGAVFGDRIGVWRPADPLPAP
jgi:hypothetical protein